MTQTISDQSPLKTAIDFKSFNMEVGLLSNVSIKKSNGRNICLQIVSAMSRQRQLKVGLKRSPSTTIYAKVNNTFGCGC